MENNVTPIFAGVPIVAAKPALPANPKASDEAIAKFLPTQDWLLVRPDDVFASAGLVKPEDIKTHPNEGVVLGYGPDAGCHIETLEAKEEFLRVQWRQQAHWEPVKIGDELLLLIRARDVVAVVAP